VPEEEEIEKCTQCSQPIDGDGEPDKYGQLHCGGCLSQCGGCGHMIGTSELDYDGDEGMCEECLE
jgi:hypothetical protein